MLTSKTPYEQGYSDGCEGLLFEQIYDQRGEELEAESYKRGFEIAYNKFFVTIGEKNENRGI